MSPQIELRLEVRVTAKRRAGFGKPHLLDWWGGEHKRRPHSSQAQSQVLPCKDEDVSCPKCPPCFSPCILTGIPPRPVCQLSDINSRFVDYRRAGRPIQLQECEYRLTADHITFVEDLMKDKLRETNSVYFPLLYSPPDGLLAQHEQNARVRFLRSSVRLPFSFISPESFVMSKLCHLW